MKKKQSVTALRWDEADEKRVAQALAIARDGLSEMATGSDIVMEVLAAVIDVARRIQNRGYRQGPIHSAWVKYDHSNLTEKDLEENFAQRMIEIAAGDPVDVVFSGMRNFATAEQEEIAESALRVFRSCIKGREPERDWKVLLAFAKGKSTRQVGRQYSKSHQWADDRRKLQLDAIWMQAKRLMPPRLAVAA